jgi:hypothetical protein
MIILFWVLWFVITTEDGTKLHFPVSTEYENRDLCEVDIPEWTAKIAQQFPDDPHPSVYCEEFPPTPKEKI